MLASGFNDSPLFQLNYQLSLSDAGGTARGHDRDPSFNSHNLTS